MPCCCCCHFDEDYDKLNEKDQLRVSMLCEKHGLLREKHPLAMGENQRLIAKRQRYSVYLNIYDLISNKRNKTLNKIGMALYHSGVEIGRYEYSFGEPVDRDVVTGIFVVPPMTAMNTLSNRIFLGDTLITPEAFATLIQRMKQEWPATKYELLHKNCNHFTRWFCKRLTTIQPLVVPNWVNRISNAADCVTPRCFAKWILKKFDDRAQAPPKSSSKTSTKITAKDAKKKEEEAKKEEKQKEANKQLEDKKKEQKMSAGNAGPRPNLIHHHTVVPSNNTTGKTHLLSTAGGAMPNFNAGREPPKKVADEGVAGKALPTSRQHLQSIITGGGEFTFGDCKVDLSEDTDVPRKKQAEEPKKKEVDAEADLSDIDFNEEDYEDDPAASALPTDNGLLLRSRSDPSPIFSDVGSPTVLIPHQRESTPKAGAQPQYQEEVADPEEDPELLEALRISEQMSEEEALQAALRESEKESQPAKIEEANEEEVTPKPQKVEVENTAMDEDYGTPVVPQVNQASLEREGRDSPMVLSTGTFNKLQEEDEAAAAQAAAAEVIVKDDESEHKDDGDVEEEGPTHYLHDGARRRSSLRLSPYGPVQNRTLVQDLERPTQTNTPPPAAGSTANASFVSTATSRLLTPPRSTQPSPTKIPPAQKKKKGFALKAKDSDDNSSGDSDGETDTTKKVAPTATTKKAAAASGITVNDKGELVVAAAPAPKAKKSKAAMAHVDPTTGESALPELNFYPEDYGLGPSKPNRVEGEEEEDDNNGDGDDMQFSDAEDMDAGGQDDDSAPDASALDNQAPGDAATM